MNSRHVCVVTRANCSFGNKHFLQGSPSVFVGKAEDEKHGGRRISVTITSFPAPFLVQWSAKCKDGDNFSPIDINAEEYKGTTVSFPHSVLVVRQSDHFEKNCFQIEVTNFIGETVQEIFGKKVGLTQFIFTE